MPPAPDGYAAPSLPQMPRLGPIMSVKIGADNKGLTAPPTKYGSPWRKSSFFSTTYNGTLVALSLSSAGRPAGDTGGPPLPARQPDPGGFRRTRKAVSHSQVDDGSGGLAMGCPGGAAPVAGRPARAGVRSAGRAAAHGKRRTACITIDVRVGSKACSTADPAIGCGRPCCLRWRR